MIKNFYSLFTDEEIDDNQYIELMKKISRKRKIFQ